MKLEGKKAVITGISKGIGKRLTLQLLEKEVHVFGWGMSQPDYTHENLTFLKTDVRSRESVNNAAEATLQEAGSIDILVNNAGLGYFGFIEDMSDEIIDKMLLTNINGTIYCTQALVKGMKQQQSGHIINISSIAGLEGMPQVSVYCASKFAVRGITESLFRELRDFGVKVTGIYPGSTETNFFDNTVGLDAHSGMMQPEEVAKQIVNVLETSDNFVTNSVVFRPLQPKKPKG